MDRPTFRVRDAVAGPGLGILAGCPPGVNFPGDWSLSY
jgi:hypothetical protein